MRKVLLIAGIIVFVACAIAFLAAIFFNYAYMHVLDGSTELYARLHSRAVIALVVGIALAVVGIVCFIVRSKV